MGKILSQGRLKTCAVDLTAGAEEAASEEAASEEAGGALRSGEAAAGASGGN